MNTELVIMSYGNLIGLNNILSMVTFTLVFFHFYTFSYTAKTPNNLIGKVMAYVSTITMCAQPLGQTVYGLLFDRFNNTVYIILIPTGIIVCTIGLLAIGLFRQLEREL